MKAYKKSMTESPAGGIGKRLGLSPGGKIMNMEQGMLKFEVLNIIVRYFLFHRWYRKRIMNREQRMLKFEVLNIIVRYFLYYGWYGRRIMNKEQRMFKFEVLNIIVLYFL